MQIEQALYGNPGEGGFRWLARSPGFREEWLPLARDLCTHFGDRPAGVRCPQALFVVPLNKKFQAIVRVADQGQDEMGRPGALAFRLLIVPVDLYDKLGADPFRLDEAFDPDWQARETLPSLEWTFEKIAMRTVAGLARVLDVEHERTAWLLGSAQILVDGGKVWLERPQPEERLIRDLWELLPYANRGELRVATFAFGNANRFDLAVAPAERRGEFVRATPEDQAGEYPEGRYELALQTAVESSDQPGLEALLLRRSRGQMFRFALVLLVLVAAAALVSRMPPILPPAPPMPQKATLPRFEAVAPFDAATQAEAKRQTAELVRSLGGEGDTPADLDRALATRLKPTHTLDDLGTKETLSRQLRAVLWKYGIADAEAPGLSVAEMFERLREAIDRRR
jgi:hypothetical protein